MSGGSWDYVYQRFGDTADRLALSKSPDRRALGNLIAIVAEALYTIEWNDSGDTEGDECEAVRRCFQGTYDEVKLRMATDEAEKALHNLSATLGYVHKLLKESREGRQ